MRLEVHSAADFLMNLLRVRKSAPLSESQLLHFKGTLEQILTRHFQRHWYPDVPAKGSGFRCLRINGKMDPIIEQAGSVVGLNAIALRKMLPLELTIWIDPEEVSYRIGENGTICVLYDHLSRDSPSSDLDSTGSSSCDEFIMGRLGRLDLSTSADSGVMVDFVEANPSQGGSNNNSSSGGGSKLHKYNNHHNNHHYVKRHNNSVSSSSSSGQNSPPLSPPFNGYNNSNNNNYNTNNRYQQSNYYSPSIHQQHQQYFHWDNQFVNNKVRTQC
ncbi:protein BTG1 [Toxorhynchites rutilus septentrionalis]|uniref:protein BTG1 n=1 Tax=Toxorhynchites rutilus septentrionalis TaxID=329112 RepID=UPI002479B63F|nr:protein BTG1 [Toxorhynchites rutilus septentrionalis]XP_055638827.1 protein BTG1 [Toxorhynchites rutilus septentrionalis]